MGSGNRLRYHRRLFLGLVAYSLVMMGAMAVFQYHREREFRAEELDGQLQIINAQLIDRLGNDSVFDPSVIARETFPGLRVSVIGTDGKIRYDNTLDSLPGTDHLDRPEIMQALTRGRGFTIRRHSSLNDQEYFYSAKRGDGFVVRTAVPYSVSLGVLLKADYTFLWVMGGITLLMCAIGYFATRRLGENVTRLRDFSRRARKGERVFDTGSFPHDELGEISSDIVRLYARLQQAVADRDREHAAALVAQQEKNRIKRQLTNNINHELKTPVASILACIETVIDHPGMEAEVQRGFLERGYASARRLRRLLEDVSMVTRLEDGSSAIEKSDVCLRDVVAEVCDEFAPLAAEHGITIDNGVTYDGPFAGNAMLLASVFRNLVDNAVAYSGGSVISLSQTVTAGSLRLFVCDNGTGVDAGHLPRIFERFYRVDKGRSRRAGGTGLGLAIVKNAVLWHGGGITAANRQSGGLEFTITLPVAQV